VDVSTHAAQMFGVGSSTEEIALVWMQSADY
jgi:hypothetical protein